MPLATPTLVPLTIHLHEEFRLDPPAGLVFAVTPSPAANGVDLINEDGAGGIVASLGRSKCKIALGRAREVKVQDGTRESQGGQSTRWC